jgi:hypothetical protein
MLEYTQIFPCRTDMTHEVYQMSWTDGSSYARTTLVGSPMTMVHHLHL